MGASAHTPHQQVAQTAMAAIEPLLHPLTGIMRGVTPADEGKLIRITAMELCRIHSALLQANGALSVMARDGVETR